MSTRVHATVNGGCATGPAAIVIRPERIALQSPDDDVASGCNVIAGTVAEVVYLGSSTQVHVDVGEANTLVVEVPNHQGPNSVTHGLGARVHCVCSEDAVRVLTRSPASVATDPVEEPENALSLS